MTDIVNSYLRQFYPEDRDTNWVMRSEGYYCGREYRGDSSPIFPKMVCVDGFEMSVQGHFGAYSYPQDDFADGYDMLEVMVDTDKLDPLLEEFGGNCNNVDFVIYSRVPISILERVIKNHGGLI